MVGAVDQYRAAPAAMPDPPAKSSMGPSALARPVAASKDAAGAAVWVFGSSAATIRSGGMAS